MTGHLVPLLFLAPLSLQNAAESHPPEPGRLWSEGGGGGEWEGTHGGVATAPWLRPRRPWSGRPSSLLLSAGCGIFWKMEGLLEPPFIDTEKHFV